MLSKTTVKYIQSLQHKKFRDEHHAFVAEGPKLIIDLIEDGFFELKMLFAVQDWVNQLNKSILYKINDKVQLIEEFELEKIAAYKSPNKVVAVFKIKSGDYDFNTKNKITLVLDDINDPGNLGTIIRTADWFGIENIVCSMNTVDKFNPKVVQSTMSSLARVNVIYADLHNWLIKNKDIPVYCTLLNGIDSKNIKNKKEGIIVIGNEANGISDKIQSLATENITIPKSGNAESLNAAIATSIVLYEFNR